MDANKPNIKIENRDGGVFMEVDGKWVSLDPKSDPLTTPQFVPPAAGKPVVPAPQALVALLSAGRRFWFSSDEALRDSRDNARKMTRNLQIMEPLQARTLATAQMPLHVEPQNKKDPAQCIEAAELEQIINEIPYLNKYKLALLEGIWYGRAAVQNMYTWDFSRGYKRMIVKDWIPINGDSLVYKWDSDAVGIRVGATSAGEGTVPLSTEPADFSRVHVLTPWEREAHTIHTHLLQAGDFLDPMQGGNIKGVGIRSVVYWTHWLQDQCLGLLTEYLERMGLGFTVVTFEHGNAESQAKAQEIAASQSFNNVITWPVMPGQTGLSSNQAIYRIEPGLNGVQNYMKLLDEYWGGQLRRYIVGQDATSKPMSTGLGSGISDVQESTFFRLVKMDCLNLEDTLTYELLRVIQKYTFPLSRFRHSVKINPDKPNVKEWMEGVKSFTDMGGEVIEDEVRSKLGLGQPMPGDKVIGGKKEAPQMPGQQPPPKGEQDDQEEEVEEEKDEKTTHIEVKTGK